MEMTLSSLARWAVRVGIGVAISVVSVVATLVWVALHPFLPPTIPLLAGLYGEWATVSREFNTRVERRFPIGSPESAMTSELRREGFVRDDWSYANAQNNEARATRHDATLPCNTIADVYWRTDNKGLLTSIRGVFQEDGCL